MKSYKIGSGLINSVINNLPFEAHLPGYQYCGPGTNLSKRIARGDPGINKLDAKCKEHDIAYDKYKKDLRKKGEADKILSSAAWDRVTSNDASMSEKAAALTVAAIMEGKIGLAKIGGGIKGSMHRKKISKNNLKMKINKKRIKKAKKCCTFKQMIAHTKKALKIAKPRSADQILDTALVASKKLEHNRIVSKPRIIPLPRTGGILPLVPIFAGLSALGSLAGGTSNIISAIQSTDNGKKALRNGQTNSIEIGHSKKGGGLYLKPYKRGYGIFLKPYPNTKN